MASQRWSMPPTDAVALGLPSAVSSPESDGIFFKENLHIHPFTFNYFYINSKGCNIGNKSLSIGPRRNDFDPQIIINNS